MSLPAAIQRRQGGLSTFASSTFLLPTNAAAVSRVSSIGLRKQTQISYRVPESGYERHSDPAKC
jgi:hypothetical protein